jgi:hypothetical protein
MLCSCDVLLTSGVEPQSGTAFTCQEFFLSANCERAVFENNVDQCSMEAYHGSDQLRIHLVHGRAEGALDDERRIRSRSKRSEVEEHHPRHSAAPTTSQHIRL